MHKQPPVTIDHPAFCGANPATSANHALGPTSSDGQSRANGLTMIVGDMYNGSPDEVARLDVVEESRMKRKLGTLAAAIAMLTAAPVLAQKSGGILKVHHQDSPASMSIIEEATYSTVVPMMGVFNNLVIYKQDEPQNSMNSIVPDLATSWSWSEDGTELTFKLRPGIKWHDGKPFTAADVKCTYDLLLGQAKEKLRINPRKAWFRNLEQVTADSEDGVSFHLRRPQPAFITLLASGYSPIYPCHVSPREMRTHPIGTGPFKFVAFKANEFDPGRAQSGLLEAGSPLSRRHRVHDYSEPVDRATRVCRRQARRDLALYNHGAAAEGH